MRKLILSLYFVILLVPSFSFAAPFLVCDPQSGVTNYKWMYQDQQWVPIL